MFNEFVSELARKEDEERKEVGATYSATNAPPTGGVRRATLEAPTHLLRFFFSFVVQARRVRVEAFTSMLSEANAVLGEGTLTHATRWLDLKPVLEDQKDPRFEAMDETERRHSFSDFVSVRPPPWDLSTPRHTSSACNFRSLKSHQGAGPGCALTGSSERARRSAEGEGEGERKGAARPPGCPQSCSPGQGTREPAAANIDWILNRSHFASCENAKI